MNWKFVNRILIFILGIEILICGFVIYNRNQENEIAESSLEYGRLAGDDIEASGYAGELDTEIELLEPQLTLDEFMDICYIVSGEAQGEPIEGKMAVAQCILNAMIKNEMRPLEIKIEYQYSGWNTELENTNPNAWSEVTDAVSRVFDNHEFVSDNPILYFYAPKKCVSRWHESLPHDQTISNHKFYYLEEDVNADWFVNLKNNT